jgi:hypothetical protein
MRVCLEIHAELDGRVDGGHWINRRGWQGRGIFGSRLCTAPRHADHM